MAPGPKLVYPYDTPPFAPVTHIDAAGNLVSTTPVAVAGPTLIHDMALTEHYVLVFDQPVILDPKKPASAEPSRPSPASAWPRPS